jgi:Virulence protein RhuM family
MSENGSGASEPSSNAAKPGCSITRSPAAEYLTSFDAWCPAVYLHIAEDMALHQIPITLQDWQTRQSRFNAAIGRQVLQDADRVSTEIVRAHAESEFEKYRIVQDRLYELDFDKLLERNGEVDMAPTVEMEKRGRKSRKGDGDAA